MVQSPVFGKEGFHPVRYGLYWLHEQGSMPDHHRCVQAVQMHSLYPFQIVIEMGEPEKNVVASDVDR